MSACFADTAYYVALLNRRDALHGAALRCSAHYTGAVVTTEFVLLEVANFLSQPPDRRLFVALADVLHQDPHTHHRAGLVRLAEGRFGVVRQSPRQRVVVD